MLQLTPVLREDAAEPVRDDPAAQSHTVAEADGTAHPVSVQAEGQPRITQLASVGNAIEWKSRNPAAHRAQRVVVNPEILDTAQAPLAVGDQVELALFDDAYVRGIVTEAQHWGRAGRTFTARARLENDPHGFMILSSVDGVLRILIQDSRTHEVYQLRYDVDLGSHVLLHVDEARSEIYACANDHSHDVADDAPGSVAASTSTEGDGAADTILDVMVVYTPGALAFEGSTANMELNISQAIMLSNQVHANSDTQIRFNLVHSALVDYTETSSGSYDLNSIMEPADGRIDIVHDWRREYGADFVSFFVSTESFGGLAYRNRTYDRPDRAFSIIRVQQSDSTSYTTVHEISHNMGNGHSKTQQVQPFNEVGLALYAAGWQWADSTSSAEIGYCSVMTYEDFDSAGGDDEYVRVAHLSNPDVSYNGNPTGDPEDGDAARVIREGRGIYEAFAAPTGLPRFDHFPYLYGFEEGETDWAQTFDDVHDWALSHSGDTPSVETGPESGAYQGSQYAYVEASDHTFEKARLSAEFDFSSLTSVSMDFAYNMFDATGAYMGSLAVELSTDQGDSWTELWRRSGDQGPDWLEASIDLSAYAGQVVRLRFVGNVGRGFRSDIAIDAIRIDHGSESDVPVDFNDWISGFPDLVATAPDEDADQDSLSNFLEYAFALSPNRRESMADVWTSEWDVDGSQLVLRFQRARASVLYKVMSSPELGDWTAATTEWSSATALDRVNVGEEQTVTVEKSGPQLFLRLEVTE